MDAPRGLIPFSKTPVSIDANRYKKQQLYISFGLVLIFGITSYWYPVAISGVLISVGISFFLNRSVSANTSIPLAVNLNHPFMETSAVSESEIMVNFAGEWMNPGAHRLKLAKDSLIGWVIHKQDEDLSILSPWETNWGKGILSKQLAIINQAISLNNAINDLKDEFEDARERESQESVLLDREWMPEEELEILGPISRLFTSE